MAIVNRHVPVPIELLNLQHETESEMTRVHYTDTRNEEYNV